MLCLRGFEPYSRWVPLIIVDCEQTSCPVRKALTKQGFKKNIPQEILKYLKQQNLSPVPLMQEIKGNMDDVLSWNDLRDDEKAKRYFQLQNRYLACKRPEEITSGVSDLTSSTQDSSTETTAALSTPLNPFNVTPELTQAAISQKPEKESLTPPPPLNPAFLTSPPTLETPSQQGPKRKRRRIQILSYLDDHNAHAKQLRKRSRHKKFQIKSYKYSMGEEDED